jgi:hypothetical protein
MVLSRQSSDVSLLVFLSSHHHHHHVCYPAPFLDLANGLVHGMYSLGTISAEFSSVSVSEGMGKQGKAPSLLFGYVFWRVILDEAHLIKSSSTIVSKVSIYVCICVCMSLSVLLE